MSETNICTRCWQGTIVNGCCSHCHHQPSAPDQRRSDALPVLSCVASDTTTYTVGEVLGNGGFGITYSAWDQVHQRRVALKEFYPRMIVNRSQDKMTITVQQDMTSAFQEMQQRFHQESSILTQVAEALRSSPEYAGSSLGVAMVYDQFQFNHTSYYAMQFLDGEDLKVYLRSHGPMSWNVLSPMVSQVLEILKPLHDINLIHRDISPDNLFLTRDNQIYLIDFGSTRFYQGNTHFTKVLKPDFAPLEQFTVNSKQGPWTDIYSLSATIYHLLSGKLPASAMVRLDHAELTPLSSLCPSLPPYVSAAIEKGLSIDYKDRYQSAREFQAALGLGPVSAPQAVSSAPRYGQHHPAAPAHQGQYWIQGLSGAFSGKRRPLQPNIPATIGRSLSSVIPYPDHFPGVSRRQCTLLVTSAGELFVKDDGSSYGTYLNGARLPTSWVRVQPGSILRFGYEEFYLIRA